MACRNKAFTVWFTGLSGSGKTTMARLLEQRLLALERRVVVLDGDVVRTHLSKGLGFSRADRDENIRRIGVICELLSRNDVIAIAAAISPYRAARDKVRASIPNFVEVHMDCPLEVLIERDVKGLYKKAIAGFTGVDAPYEPPATPELTIHSDRETPDEGLKRLWGRLQTLGLVTLR